MSAPQKTYRVYRYDGVHKAVSADLIEALTDDQAVTEAEAAGFGTKCEIWEGHRLVAALGGEHRAA